MLRQSLASLLVLFLVTSLILLAGCQKSPQSLVDELKEPDQPGSEELVEETLTSLMPVGDTIVPQVDISPDASPQQVIERFVKALQEEDKQVVTGLLTIQARRATQQYGLVVRPEGTESATFQIGAVERVDGGAYVNCTWTESIGGGVSQSFEIIWVLRKQNDGWRVVGMATQVLPTERPTFLNFEEPEEMLSKWRMIDDTLEGRSRASQQAAGDPRNRLRR
jgi:hypothetical protein